MKKALAFVVILALVLGGVAVAARSMQDTAGEVTVTSTTQAGDPAAAQGLLALQSLCYGQDLRWDLTVPLADPAAAETDVTDRGEVPPAVNEDKGVYIRFASNSVNMGSDPGYAPETLETGNFPVHKDLLPLVRAVAANTPAGQSHTETVDASQYLTGYPLEVTLDLAAEEPDYSQEGTFENQFQEDAVQAIQDFFRFLIAPEVRWTVTVVKDADGLLTQLTIVPMDTEPLGGTLSAVGRHSAYFTFGSQHLDGSNLADFSHVPGGYGIYRLDCPENDGGRFWADPDSLRTVYPLKPGQEQPVNLTLSPDEQTLYLVLWTGDQYECRVLDADTMALRQTFPIPAAPPQALDQETGEPTTPDRGTVWYDLRHLVVGEDCLLAIGDDTLHAFARGADGQYQYLWSASRPSAYQEGFLPNVRAAWNGEKLALGFVDGQSEEPGLTLLVYDAQGKLLYHGTYTTSLNNLGLDGALVEERSYGAGRAEDSNVSLVPEPAGALTLTWQKAPA